MKNPDIQFLSDPAPFREKERLYLEVRRRENRILSDEAVQNLPFTQKSDPHAREWEWRRRSFSRLEHYLSDRFSGKHTNMLDLGCGNGWMANRLALHKEWKVCAVDMNEPELTQGARLFGRENLQFVYANIMPRNDIPERHEIPFQDAKFDVIILAAAVQYFSSFSELTGVLRRILKPGGEIHIIDSQFYKNGSEQVAARQRSQEYYTRVGVPEMAGYYHHHLWQEAKKSGAKNLNNQLSVKVLQKIGWLAPFPWLRL